MENCYVCKVDGKMIRLFDAVYNGRNTVVCERCSIIENIPIIKKPLASQLKEAKVEKIYDRMIRISGVKPFLKKEIFFKKDRLKELEANPKLELPEKNNLDLIDHFHWEIMKNRRRRGLTQSQFAKYLGESPVVIEMIERGNLPEDADVIIRKIEQFLHIKLTKTSIRAFIKKEIFTEPVLLDERGNKLEVIPEEEMIFKSKEKVEESKTDDEEYVDFKKIDKNNMTIGDLKNINRRRVEASKIEQIEEQKKIEERKRFIMALREKDVLEGKKNILLNRPKSIIEKSNEEYQRNLSKKDFDDIDNRFGGRELIDKNFIRSEKNRSKYRD